MSFKYEDKCVIIVDGKKKKIPCHTFKHKGMKRELAVHECVVNPHDTTISDVITGCRLCDTGWDKELVTKSEIEASLSKFISHYTMELIEEKFKEIESKQKGE